MISLEQIRALEQKVNQAIQQLSRLREENAKLRSQVKSSQLKTTDLETTITTYKQEQESIEKGILSVLSKLDKLEDEVSLTGSAPGKEAQALSATADETVVRENKPSDKDTGKSGRAKTRPAGTGQGGAQDELDIF
jgi:FtsZ-binding cell division protein ZapB